MVRLSIAYNYKMKAIDVEFNMPRPSYTIDTLTYLQEQYKEHKFVLIVGEDNLDQFPRWKNYEKILEFFSLYVYPRPKAPESPLWNHPKIKRVEAPLLDISATYIRNAVKAGKSIQYLVTPEVETFILQKKFYL
jgi:nicotinate-nucleotide adenylyltransferase